MVRKTWLVQRVLLIAVQKMIQTPKSTMDVFYIR